MSTPQTQAAAPIRGAPNAGNVKSLGRPDFAKELSTSHPEQPPSCEQQLRDYKDTQAKPPVHMKGPKEGESAAEEGSGFCTRRHYDLEPYQNNESP